MSAVDVGWGTMRLNEGGSWTKSGAERARACVGLENLINGGIPARKADPAFELKRTPESQGACSLTALLTLVLS